MQRYHEPGDIGRPSAPYPIGKILRPSVPPPIEVPRPASQPMASTALSPENDPSAPPPAPPAPAPLPVSAAPPAPAPAPAPPPREPVARRAPAPAPSAARGRGREGLALIDLMTGLVEYRDPFFRGASSFTRHLAAAVARQMGLDDHAVIALEYAALLRDTGRMALNGMLIPPMVEVGSDERAQIERHVPLGLDMLESIGLPPGTREAIRHHHERWDGRGYPDGLRGERIPLLARILHVADSFSAMVSARPYRPPRRFDEAVREIEDGADRMYDPAVVRALLQVIENHEYRTAGFGLHDHILVVHPDQPRGVKLAVELCSRGYLAEVAPDLASARARLPGIPLGAILVAALDPPGESVAFVEQIREIARYREIPIVAFDFPTASERVEMIHAGVDACFSTGFELDELLGTLGAALTRTRRVQELRARETTAAGHPAASFTGLQGSLHEFPLSWLLQTLQYDGRGAVVTIQGPGGKGAVALHAGELFHAETEWSTGEPAFFDILDWTEGSFQVQPSNAPGRRTIERPMMNLILNHAARADEKHAPFGSVATD